MTAVPAPPPAPAPEAATPLPKFLGHPDDLCEQWIAETWEPDPRAAWDREDMQSAYREGRDEARRQLAPQWGALAARARDYALKAATACNQRDEAQDERDALAAERDQLRENVAECDDVISDLERVKDALAARLADTQAEADRDRTAAVHEHNRLIRELEATEEKRAALAARLAEATAEKASWREVIAVDKRHVRRLEAENSHLTARNLALTEALRRCADEKHAGEAVTIASAVLEAPDA